MYSGRAYNSEVPFVTFRDSLCFVLGIGFNAITSPYSMQILISIVLPLPRYYDDCDEANRNLAEIYAAC